jgi:hypothetical protein
MTSLFKSSSKKDAWRQSLKWSRKTPLKKGDLILVSNYFSHQEVGELVRFRIMKVTSPERLENCPDQLRGIQPLFEAALTPRSTRKYRPMYFTQYRSPDVMGAQVIATYPELFKYRLKAWFYNLRRDLAYRIFPEGL